MSGADHPRPAEHAISYARRRWFREQVPHRLNPCSTAFEQGEREAVE